MLSEYTDKIYLMVDWFCRAKEVAIEAESMDNTGYVQPLHEQRYCLDHFIRAINYEKENQKDSKQLIEKALNSAISHLQRCYSDCIEWMLIVVDEYEAMLSGYTTQQICIGFPEYYERIRPDMEKITEKINTYKIQKSSEKANEVDLSSISEQFVSDDVIKTIKECHSELYLHIPSLDEIKRNKSKRIRTRKQKNDFFRKNTFSNNNWRNWGSCCDYYNQFLLSVPFGNPIEI